MENLYSTKKQLVNQLEILRSERLAVDRQFAEEVEYIYQVSMEGEEARAGEVRGWLHEIEDFKDKNCKLEVRIR